MLKLDEIGIAKTIPQSISGGQKTADIIAAIDPQLRQIYAEQIGVLLLPRLDVLSESLVDELAWQYHVDAYDASLSIEQKRELVRNSISVHRIKGTPAAVESVITSIFRSAKIKEWYEYDGRPYYFKIQDILEGIESPEAFQLLIDAVNATKNTRSWLEDINFLRKLEGEINLALILTIDAEVKIYPALPLMPDINTDINAGGAIMQHRKVVLR